MFKIYTPVKQRPLLVWCYCHLWRHKE